MTSTPHASVSASAGRRVAGFVTLYGLGALLIYLGATHGFSGVLWRLFVLAIGAGALMMGERMRRTSSTEILLTDEGLVTSDGTVLAARDNIAKVDRGTFAVKPSNGFSVILKTKQPFLWAPGLYWRFGKRLGIGGVTAPAASKYMSEMLMASLADEAADD